MSTAVMTGRLAAASPRAKARLAGFFYLLTFVVGIVALASPENALLADLVATPCYVAVTLLFYGLFKPAHRGMSLVAALVSLAGCAVGLLNRLQAASLPVSPLVFFGVYCLFLAFLVARSSFLPRFLAPLLAAAGLGWLTFLSPSFSKALAPYNMIPGVLGEGVLMVWLMVKGVDEARWREQSGSGEAPR